MSRILDSNRLYRSGLRRKISGVCAGVAQHFDFPVWAVRVAAILMFFAFPVPVALAYVIAILLIPLK